MFESSACSLGETNTRLERERLCKKLSSVQGTRDQLKISNPKESKISILSENIPTAIQCEPSMLDESMLIIKKHGKLVSERFSN